jgi:hypothetical protein
MPRHPKNDLPSPASGPCGKGDTDGDPIASPATRGAAGEDEHCGDVDRDTVGRVDDEVLSDWRAQGLPVEVLSAMQAWLGDEAASRFPRVVEQIDPERELPQHELAWIADQLIGMGSAYELRIGAEASTLEPAREIERLRTMETAVASFFEALGTETIPSQHGGLPAPLGMLLPDVVNVAAIDGPTVLRNTRIMLRILWAVGKAAGRAADMAAYNSPARGHGGARRDRPAPITDLVHRLLDVYANIRERFPNSGPKPGFGGPLIRFIRASLDVIDQDVSRRMTDNSIRGHFNSWKTRKVGLQVSSRSQA